MAIMKLGELNIAIEYFGGVAGATYNPWALANPTMFIAKKWGDRWHTAVTKGCTPPIATVLRKVRRNELNCL